MLCCKYIDTGGRLFSIQYLQDGSKVTLVIALVVWGM